MIKMQKQKAQYMVKETSTETLNVACMHVTRVDILNKSNKCIKTHIYI